MDFASVIIIQEFEMEKVGLCTQFEKIDNYGTVLQAYATFRFINTRGYTVKFVRYKKKYTIKFILQQAPRIFEKSNWTGIKRSFRLIKARRKSIKFNEYTKARIDAFNEFREKYFPESMIDE